MLQEETLATMVSYYKMLSIGALNVTNKFNESSKLTIFRSFFAFLFNLLYVLVLKHTSIIYHWKAYDLTMHIQKNYVRQSAPIKSQNFAVTVGQVLALYLKPCHTGCPTLLESVTLELKFSVMVGYGIQNFMESQICVLGLMSIY